MAMLPTPLMARRSSSVLIAASDMATSTRSWKTMKGGRPSRWATVRSLVEGGTFVVGTRSRPDPNDKTKYADDGIIFEDGWQSVDKVLHPERDEFYSSKPPLLSVLMAGAYWPLYHWGGLSLKEEPFLVVRLLVGLLNLLPLPLFLWLLYRIGERYSTSPWTPADSGCP